MPGQDRNQTAGQSDRAPWPATAADLSCVISAHRRPNLIADSIRSVLAQTEPIGEIIVVTDVESPETETIVNELATSSHIPIRWVDRSGDRSPGVSGSRNRGVAEANGTWIAQLDDDDEWLPTFAAEMLAAINDSSASVALCAKVRFGNPIDEGIVIPVHPGFSGSQMVRADRFAHGGNVVIEAALARRFPYDTQFLGAEDWDLFIRLDHAEIGYLAVPLPLLRSRIHGDGRVSQSGVHIARMYRQLAHKHRHVLDLGARRSLRFQAIWIERMALSSRPARLVAGVKLVAMAPYSRIFIDAAYRARLVARIRPGSAHATRPRG